MKSHPDESIWHQKLDWKTKPFTYRYAQPPEYHYSLDSIELMWRLGTFLQNQIGVQNLRVLDLCSGCGVLGFELNFWVPEKISSIEFVDVQIEYESYFERNRLITGTSDKPMTFRCMNYNQIPQMEHFKEAFDLVLCNPPYFRSDSGSLGKSAFRNRCDFLLDGSFAELCAAICHSLAPDGQAYILLKDLGSQGIDQLRELQENSGPDFNSRVISVVRGTPVIMMNKPKKNLKSF
jgi:tRNA1Val (adenine37-N6)-methyltransferase